MNKEFIQSSRLGGVCISVGLASPEWLGEVLYPVGMKLVHLVEVLLLSVLWVIY